LRGGRGRARERAAAPRVEPRRARLPRGAGARPGRRARALPARCGGAGGARLRAGRERAGRAARAVAAGGDAVTDQLLGARWVPGSGARFASRDPVRRTIVWEGRAAGPEQVAEAVAAARRAFEPWRDAGLEARLAVLRRFAALLGERADELAAAIGRETGKPRWEAAGEVRSMVAKVEISVRAQAERAGTRERELPGGVRAVVRHRPHGVL